MINRLKLQNGFTLAELVMALAIFSFMFMIVISGFIQVTKIYEAGVASRTTQQNARLILEDFSKLARSAGSVTSVADAQHPRVCLSTGSGNYEYAIDSAGSIWLGIASDATCPQPSQSSFVAPWRKISDPTVQVVAIQTSSTPSVGSALGTVSISLTVASTYDISSVDTTNPKNIVCKGTGSQYCSVATLFTTVALNGGSTQ